MQALSRRTATTLLREHDFLRYVQYQIYKWHALSIALPLASEARRLPININPERTIPHYIRTKSSTPHLSIVPGSRSPLPDSTAAPPPPHSHTRRRHPAPPQYPHPHCRGSTPLRPSHSSRTPRRSGSRRRSATACLRRTTQNSCTPWCSGSLAHTRRTS